MTARGKGDAARGVAETAPSHTAERTSMGAGRMREATTVLTGNNSSTITSMTRTSRLIDHCLEDATSYQSASVLVFL